MDRFTYFPANAEYGVYSARRFPKGAGSVASLAAQHGNAGAITDIKPNYAVIPARYVASDVTPHANTERWTYTVPKGRRAQVQNLICAMQRKTAGAPNATSQASISIVRFGKLASESEIIAVASDVLGVADSGRVRAMTSSPGSVIDLFEGDLIKASTVDVSTGGTIDFFVTATISEFDSGINYDPMKANSLQSSFGSIPPRATFGTGATAGFLTGEWLKQFTG